MAWESHPHSGRLNEVLGELCAVQVEQMNTRDQLTISLWTATVAEGNLGLGDGGWTKSDLDHHCLPYTTYLDVGTQVVLAQLQDLLPALHRGAQVHIRYLDDTAASGRPNPSGYRWFYSVKVLV